MLVCWGSPWKLHHRCNNESRLKEQVWIKVLSTRHPHCVECQQAGMQCHMHVSNLPCSRPSLEQVAVIWSQICRTRKELRYTYQFSQTDRKQRPPHHPIDANLIRCREICGFELDGYHLCFSVFNLLEFV